MIYFIFFIIELLCLFFLSRLLTTVLSMLFLRVTRSQKMTIHLLSFLFLPGVMVHELSHMFMASMLFVRVGEVEFFPQIQGDVVKLGSVAIAKTDILRRFLIGAAPLFGGIGILLSLFLFLHPRVDSLVSWQSLIFGYALFEIGNTMFSSKKDMEGAIVLLLAGVVFLAVAFALGVRLQVNFFTSLFSPSVTAFFQTMDILLLFPVLGNSIFCLLVKNVLGR